MNMNVYMLKDVEKVGMAGQIVKVADGYAANYLFPRKLAVEATENNMEQLKARVVKETINAQVLSSKIAMLAERLKSVVLTIKSRVHDDGKLYGAVSADDIVDLLKAQDVVVNRKQIEFDKTIKTVGEHKATIRLSAKLKPQVTVKVVAQKESK